MSQPQTAKKRIQITNCDGVHIASFNDWATYALPPQRRDLHWQEGRSACELGQIWTMTGEPSVPSILARLLESNEGTNGIEILSGITEQKTKLPFSNGGPRCHDLALLGEQAGHLVTICIEAKADESFGTTAAKEFTKATKREGSHYPMRLQWLVQSLLGLSAFEDEQLRRISAAVAEVPYQLLSAVAGTLLEAERQGALKAVLVVHEFRTSKTEDKKLEENASVLNQFLRQLMSANKCGREDFKIENGQMAGPITIQARLIVGKAHLPIQIPLFIGKISTNLLA